MPLQLKKIAAASVPAPATDRSTLFLDSTDGLWKTKDAAGTVATLKGDTGAGVPTGGTAGQVLQKIDGANYNTQWSTLSYLVNPMTTSGDVIYGGASGAPTRLGAGSNGQVLTLASGVPTWATPASGGMSNPMTTAGDLIYGGASGAATRLAVGANGTVLGVVSGAPAWGSLSSFGIAPLASPTFTGTPAAPTASAGTSSTQLATTAFVNTVSTQAVTSATTVTPTFANDLVVITAQAAALTLANPTGTAQQGWGLVVRIKDNGTARAISYGTQYRAIGVTLPTTTVASKTLYLGLIYNATDTKWDVVSVGQEA